MPSLWFIVPAHGRVELARICLRQLKRTCDQLTAHGIEARAVVVAEDENLDTARDLGFGTVERNNQFLSRKFNDGIQLATDPAINDQPADYVVPFGSDDWADWRLFTDTPPNPNSVIGFQQMSFVREDGHEYTSHLLNYPGGAGIRIYPRQLLEPLNYRPAAEDLPRGCDTSILHHVQRANPSMEVLHRHLHPAQLIDWKSPGENLNAYHNLRRHKVLLKGNPWDDFTDWYSLEALAEMRGHYSSRLVAA